MAVLSVVATVAVLTSGCTLLADGEQKKTVTETFAALPEPVNRALRAGKVRMHFYNEAGKDVGADRQIRLDAVPAQDTTLGGWVAGCRAMVQTLAPTPARLYGRLPDGPAVYEATDTLCLRGLGHLQESDEAPSLILGLPKDGQVMDTAVNFDPDAGTIKTFGYGWRARGAVIPVDEPVLAALDAAVRPVSLPWRQADGARTTKATFLVPAGTALQVTASCGADWKRAEHVAFYARPDGNRLSFGGGAPSAVAQGMVPCGATLRHALRPQVSYRTADGRQVDRYRFVTTISATGPDEAAPSIAVTKP